MRTGFARFAVSAIALTCALGANAAPLQWARYNATKDAKVNVYAVNGAILTSATDDGNDAQVDAGCDNSGLANSNTDYSLAAPGIVRLQLTAAELTTPVLCVYLDLDSSDDGVYEDTVVFETYGHSSAMHARIGWDTGDSYAAAADLQTRTPAALESGRTPVVVKAMDAGTITPAVIATGAFDSDALDTTAVTEITGSAAFLTVTGGVVLYQTTVNGTPANNQTFVGAAGPTQDQMHINRRLCVADASDALAIDCGWIQSYNGTSKTWVLDRALRFTVASGDTIRILPIERTAF